MEIAFNASVEPLILPPQIHDIFRFGSKILIITEWDNKTRILKAYLDQDKTLPRIQNETTEIYKQLVEDCKMAVKDAGKPLTFLFRPATGSKLHHWGISKGAELFNGWDSVESDHNGGMIFTKTFTA